MSRRKAATKNVILPDPLFGSQLLAKFINIVMCDGKKSIAEKIVYGALQKCVERYKKEGKAKDESDDGKEGGSSGSGNIREDASARKIALDIFEKCLNAIRPTIESRTRRVGGANYQVPVEVQQDRGIALAMRWLVEFSQSRSEKTMAIRLVNEMFDALNNKGGSIKKRESVHSTAKANLAFAHFRWT